MKKLLWVLAAVLVILAGTGIYYGNNGLFAPAVTKDVAIPKGAGTGEIARLLKENGIIKSELAFKLAWKMDSSGKAFQAGKGSFSSKMSYAQIIQTLTGGMSTAQKVTIPEGYELWQIADLFVEKCGADKDKFYDEVAHGSFDYPFLSGLPQGKNRLEGYLFPETYYVEEGASEHEMIDMCLAQFGKIYTPEKQQRAKELGFTDNQLITLASIIERECSIDRELVSSVFHNRLKSTKYKYLESCSTVIYVTKNPKARLSTEDIKVNSPYNTYMNPGLPPGPIASPGEEAILAALYPADTDYYFFSDMGGGKNTFSKTYEEHMAKQN